MSDFSRFTTPKGQLLLNIKPPSVQKQTNNQQERAGTPTPTSNIILSQSKYIPYTTGSNSSHRGQVQPQPILGNNNNIGYTNANRNINNNGTGGVYQTSNNTQVYIQRQQNQPPANKNVYLYGGPTQQQYNNIQNQPSRILVNTPNPNLNTGQPSTYYSIVQPTIIPDYKNTNTSPYPVNTTANTTQVSNYKNNYNNNNNNINNNNYNSNNNNNINNPQPPKYPPSSQPQQPSLYPSPLYPQSLPQYRQKQFVGVKTNKKIGDTTGDYDRLGQPDSDNSQKRGKRVADDTICCFPGYWLLMLILAVVFATIFLIYFRTKIGATVDQRTFNNGTDLTNNTNGSAGTSGGSVNGTTINTNTNTNPNTNTNTNTNTNISPSSSSSSSTSPSASTNEPQTSFQLPPDTTSIPAPSYYIPPPSPTDTSSTSFMLPPVNPYQHSHKYNHKLSSSPLLTQKHHRYQTQLRHNLKSYKQHSKDNKQNVY